MVAAFEEAGIPYFINNLYFGALYPGIQIPWYNERAILVHPLHYDEAMELVHVFRQEYVRRSESLTFTSAVRVIAEGALFGWAVVANNKSKSGS